MQGFCILLEADPRGQFKEGIIYGTPLPGVVVETKAAATLVGNRPTFQLFSGSSGARQNMQVLLEDDLQGKTYADAYVSGTRCRTYNPVPGEEFNMLVADVAGTGDDHAIGDTMMVQTATGRLIVDSSGASKPFTLLEAATDPTAAAWMRCVFNGW